MRWYVVQSQSRRETYASTHLKTQGFNTFIPYIEELGKQKLMFPRYLFVAFDLNDEWRRINGTRGVRRLMCYEETPASLPVGFIEELQGQGTFVRTPQLELVPGQSRLTMQGGAFAGHEGLYQSGAGQRVKILLSLLGGDVIITAPITQVARAA